VALWPNQEFTLIGALALTVGLDGYERQTNDIDITLIVPPETVRERLLTLPGWTPSGHADHEWTSSAGAKVHILPITENDLLAGELTWPWSGRKMSVVGMHLAFKHRVPVLIEKEVSIQVATVPCIVALKSVSYGDRPYGRERDLGDFAEAMVKYVSDLEDRRWSSETEFLDADEVSSFLLGKDVGTICGPRELQCIYTLLDKVETESDGGRAQATMLRLSPPSLRYRPENLLRQVASFRSGLEMGSRPI